jgi:hypothetical protein
MELEISNRQKIGKFTLMKINILLNNQWTKRNKNETIPAINKSKKKNQTL